MSLHLSHYQQPAGYLVPFSSFAWHASSLGAGPSLIFLPPFPKSAGGWTVLDFSAPSPKEAAPRFAVFEAWAWWPRCRERLLRVHLGQNSCASHSTPPRCCSEFAQGRLWRVAQSGAFSAPFDFACGSARGRLLKPRPFKVAGSSPTNQCSLRSFGPQRKARALRMTILIEVRSRLHPTSRPRWPGRARTLAPTSLRSCASPDSRGRLSPRGPIRCLRHCLPPLRKNRAVRLRSGHAPMGHSSVVVMRAWRGQECPRYTSSRFLDALRLRSGQALEAAPFQSHRVQSHESVQPEILRPAKKSAGSQDDNSYRS
jgi:hypothetical protein